MSDQQNDEREQKVIKQGPGDLLQAARIEQGITLEDIARQMNLNAKILQSIEEDDYSDIQSPIFMRGYLRTYSRLVGIDEENTIKLFAGFYQIDEPELQSVRSTAPEISSNDFRVKWMTYGVIIGLIALLLVWWVNNYKTDGVDAADSIIESVEEQVAAVIQSESISPVIELAEELTEQTDMGATQDSVVEEEITEQQIEEPSESVSPVVVNTPTPEVIVEENQPVKNVKTIQSSAGKDVLELTIVAASWGNIKDASGYQLVKDLLSAGDSLRLIGQKPFNIFLGNGNGVEIILNGEAIDFSSHVKSSNNTARFELGQ